MRIFLALKVAVDVQPRVLRNHHEQALGHGVITVLAANLQEGGRVRSRGFKTEAQSKASPRKNMGWRTFMMHNSGTDNTEPMTPQSVVHMTSVAKIESDVRLSDFPNTASRACTSHYSVRPPHRGFGCKLSHRACGHCR